MSGWERYGYTSEGYATLGTYAFYLALLTIGGLAAFGGIYALACLAGAA